METEINQLLEDLERLGRNEVRDEIKKSWNMTVLDYSRSMYSYQPKAPLEPALTRAFEKELVRLEHTPSEIKKIVESLNRRRVIQTGPHVVASYGPRMLCLDWQSSLGVAADDYYVVGMYSGIPYSNIFYPGHLTFNSHFKLEEVLSKNSEFYNDAERNQKVLEDSFGLKERRITLIPSKIQDELVYRSSMTEKTRKTVGALTPSLQKYFKRPSLNEDSYSKWAIQSNQALLSDALKKDNLVYLDINEVATNYLVDVLAQPDHIMYKILFDTATRNKFLKYFDTGNIFLLPYMSGKFSDHEGLSIAGDRLLGKHSALNLKPEVIIDALLHKRLCPGLLLSFTLLAFINGFKCLGSFRQAVYLPEYKQKWVDSGLLSSCDFADVPACNITTGFFPDSDQNDIRPLDIALGKKYSPDPERLFGELILSIGPKFLT